MSATYRYTGANAVIYFNGTLLSSDFTEIVVELSVRVEDKTAGNDTDQSFNPTIREGKATLKKFDVGETDSTAAALRVGTQGTLEIRPKGTAAGLPVLSFPAIVTGYKASVIFNKNTLVEAHFVKSGPMTKDLGAVQ